MEAMLNENVVDAVTEGTKYGCKTDNVVALAVGMVLGVGLSFAMKPLKKAAKWAGRKLHPGKVSEESNVIDFNDGKNQK